MVTLAELSMKQDPVESFIAKVAVAVFTKGFPASMGRSRLEEIMPAASGFGVLLSREPLTTSLAVLQIAK